MSRLIPLEWSIRPVRSLRSIRPFRHVLKLFRWEFVALWPCFMFSRLTGMPSQAGGDTHFWSAVKCTCSFTPDSFPVELTALYFLPSCLIIMMMTAHFYGALSVRQGWAHFKPIFQQPWAGGMPKLGRTVHGADNRLLHLSAGNRLLHLTAAWSVYAGDFS